MGFLKLFFPKKTFLKCPFLILHIKILLQTNFYMVSKFAEHLQHFHDINRLLKQIWPLRIFLNWYFHQKNSQCTHSLWFKTVPNFLEQCQYFAVFQHLDWEFDQGADFKKLVSFIIAGILIRLWLHILLS